MSPERTTNSSPPGSLGELTRVALPLALSSGSMSIMHAADRLVLSWYSEEALAAALAAGMMSWTLLSIPLGIATYINTFIAQYEGAQEPDQVARSLWQGIWLGVFGSFFLLLLLPFSGWMFAAFEHDPAVQQHEVTYFNILLLGSIPYLLGNTLSCFYSGRGFTVLILAVNLAANFINIVLDFVLVFGLGPIPAMGIAGAAWATAFANLVIFLSYAGYMAWDPAAHRYHVWTRFGFVPELFRRLLKFGVPNGLHMFLEVICMTVFVQLVGQLGTREMAATSLVFSLNFLAYSPLLGLGTAVSTLVGQRIGENRPELAVRTTWLSFGIATIYTLCFCAIYIFLPELIVAPYASGADPEGFAALQSQVVVLLRFVAVYALFDAMAVVFGNAIRGAGDTRFVLILSATSGWLLMVLPTWYAFQNDMGDMNFAFGGVTAFIVVLGVGCLLRFQGGQWKGMRVTA